MFTAMFYSFLQLGDAFDVGTYFGSALHAFFCYNARGRLNSASGDGALSFVNSHFYAIKFPTPPFPNFLSPLNMVVVLVNGYTGSSTNA